MIQHQKTLMLSPYTEKYIPVVPQDNVLRRMNEIVDFSFVYNELEEKYCFDNGRTAIHPIRMFKYLLLKTIHNVSD